MTRTTMRTCDCCGATEDEDLSWDSGWLYIKRGLSHQADACSWSCLGAIAAERTTWDDESAG